MVLADAVSITCVLLFMVSWGADVASFGSQNVPFAMPVASPLAPWGTIERSRGTWEHKKGDLGMDGSDFVWISGPHSEICHKFWSNIRVFFLIVSGSRV